MFENTNKAIAINSIINYAKMVINTILALFTTRFALQALGVTDYGLFSVLGSIISFIGVFNTVMLSTCNRFISVAIGKGDTFEINKQFNVNFIIFLGLAVFLAVVAIPVGEWYIHYHLVYSGPLENAETVFIFSILGSIISTLATPYNGLLVAKERFFIFSLVEVINHIIRFAVVLVLVNNFEKKLLIYSVTMAITTAAPLAVYWLYCRRFFKEYIKLSFPRDKKAFKDVFSFSGWVTYGAVACLARNQGASILVNSFFNTAINAALGIANSLIAYVQMFAANITQPIQPQITKSYIKGDIDRTSTLLIMSTKVSFLMMLLVSTPFFVSGNWILSIWLGDVPEYLLSFTILLIIDSLVSSFNSGISVLIFATGKIVLYQVLINTLRLLSIAVAYYVLKLDTQPELLFITYIIFSLIIVIATQYCLYKTIGYRNKDLITKSFIPSLIILALMMPVYLWLPTVMHPISRIILSVLYLLILIFYIGLSGSQRSKLYSVIKSLLFS